jgi:hypothetical protein
MTITVNTLNLFTQITPDGSSDWDSKSLFPLGMRVWGILFYPSAAQDIICIKESNEAGPIIFKAVDVEGRGLFINFPGNIIFPYLDQSECTFDTASNVVITFYQS